MSVSIHFGKLNSNRTCINHGTKWNNGILTENLSVSVRGYYIEVELK